MFEQSLSVHFPARVFTPFTIQRAKLLNADWLMVFFLNWGQHYSLLIGRASKFLTRDWLSASLKKIYKQSARMFRRRFCYKKKEWNRMNSIDELQHFTANRKRLLGSYRPVCEVEEIHGHKSRTSLNTSGFLRPTDSFRWKGQFTFNKRKNKAERSERKPFVVVMKATDTGTLK